jgi:hypothetical protein
MREDRCRGFRPVAEVEDPQQLGAAPPGMAARETRPERTELDVLVDRERRERRDLLERTDQPV